MFPAPAALISCENNKSKSEVIKHKNTITNDYWAMYHNTGMSLWKIIYIFLFPKSGTGNAQGTFFFIIRHSSNLSRITSINTAASDTWSFKYFRDTMWEWPPQTLSAISIKVILSPLSGWTVARGHRRLPSRLTLMPSSTFSPPYTSIPSSSKPISSKYSLSTTKQPIRAGLLGD